MLNVDLARLKTSLIFFIREVMKMLHKYLCRIVTNAYQIIDDGIYFEIE